MYGDYESIKHFSKLFKFRVQELPSFESADFFLLLDEIFVLVWISI